MWSIGLGEIYIPGDWHTSLYSSVLDYGELFDDLKTIMNKNQFICPLLNSINSRKNLVGKRNKKVLEQILSSQ